MVKGFMTAILSFAAVIGLISVVQVSKVQAYTSADVKKVTICHSHQPQPSQGGGAGPQDNPYNRESINKSAVFNAGHDEHDGPVFNNTNQLNWGDIIPEFDYVEKVRGVDTVKHYDGLNWTELGQAIWNNGCKYPSPEIVVRVNCDRQDRVRVIIRNTGTAEGTVEVNGDPYVIPAGEREVVRFADGTHVVVTMNGEELYNETVTCNDATPLEANTVVTGKCVEATRSFVLTFINTGNKESVATVNGKEVAIPADGKAVDVSVVTGSTPTKITVVLDGKTVLDTTKVCIQGRGSVTETPVLPTGSGAAVGDVTSLPVTSGAGDKAAALVVMIGSILATAGGYALRARSGELSI